MPASLEQIEWCDVPLVPPIPDPRWEAEFMRRFGRPTNFLPFLTPVRWMFLADEVLESRVTPNLSPDLEKLISLVVAMDNSCRYCYGAYRSVLKIMGYSERLIRKMEESLAVDELMPQEKIVLEFARKVTRSAPRVSAVDLKELSEAGFSQIQIAEIAYIVGNNAIGNRVATLLALPPAEVEKLESSWVRKFLKPMIRRKFRDSMSKVEVFEPDGPYRGPGSRIVEALSESPAGGALAMVLSEAWKSHVTSRRVKALIFAVVAKGLLCPTCEAEAAALFRKEGWTDEEIAHLLSNLTSDRLDTFELKVLRFARETVRYQTRRIQTLAREFAKGLEREVVIEVIGLVSLANGLARMSSVLQEC